MEQMDFTSKTELLKALLLARKKFGKVVKGSKGQYGKYADLSDVLDAIEDPLVENGLQILQPPDIRDGVACLHTILAHESGQAMESWYPIKEDTSGSKNELQAEGSGISYQRRYAICSLLGIAWGDDDDGAGARQPQQGGESGSGAASGTNAGVSDDVATAKKEYEIIEKTYLVTTGDKRTDIRKKLFKHLNLPNDVQTLESARLVLKRLIEELDDGTATASDNASGDTE